MKKLLLIFIVLSFYGCSSSRFHPKWTNEKSPETFIARFETSKGFFDIEVNRSLSPQAADRMFQLVNHHFFDNTLFYRVVRNYVVQFGSIDTTITNQWERYKVLDEPVLKSNLKGTVSFARSGKDSRGTQLFINIHDNSILDTLNYGGAIGYPVLGAVINGMNVVESLFSGYGDKVFEKFDSLSSNRQIFLSHFPKLDSIKRTLILKPKK